MSMIENERWKYLETRKKFYGKPKNTQTPPHTYLNSYSINVEYVIFSEKNKNNYQNCNLVVQRPHKLYKPQNY